MTVAEQRQRTIKLVVISDINCPWCYIGQRALTGAIARCADLPITFDLEYRPFCLKPDLSADTPIDKVEHYAKKFGPEKFQTVQKIVSDRAAQEGINFVFAGPMTQTTRAHRLLLKAWTLGGQDVQQPVLEALFKAYCEEQKDVGDFETLAAIAQDAGVMSKQDALKFLKSDECEKEVLDMIADTARKGISGVPFTIIDGKWAVSGGQTTEVFCQIFKKLAAADFEARTPTSGPPSATTVPS